MTLEEHEEMINIGAILSQDLFDFKCHGHTISSEREQRFKQRLARYSVLSKLYTAKWQKDRGINIDNQEKSPKSLLENS